MMLCFLKRSLLATGKRNYRETKDRSRETSQKVITVLQKTSEGFSYNGSHRIGEKVPDSG